MSFVTSQQEAKRLNELYQQQVAEELHDVEPPSDPLPFEEAQKANETFRNLFDGLKDRPLQNGWKLLKNTGDAYVQAQFKNTIGAPDVLWSMTTGLFGSLSGHAAATYHLETRTRSGDYKPGEYWDVYHDIQAATTYEPKGIYSKQLYNTIEGLYQEWIEERYRGGFMDEIVAEAEASGDMQDADIRALAALLYALPDAVMMFSPFAAKGAGSRNPAFSRFGRKEGLPPLEGEYVPGEAPAPKSGLPTRRGVDVDMEIDPKLPRQMLEGPDYKGLPKPDAQSVKTSVKDALDKGYPIEAIMDQIKDLKTTDEVVTTLANMRETPPIRAPQGAKPTDFEIIKRGQWTTLVRIKETGQDAVILTEEYRRMLEEATEQKLDTADIDIAEAQAIKDMAAAEAEIMASAPRHILEGMDHFGNVDQYVHALTNERSKWDGLSRKALEEFDTAEVIREFKRDLPGFVKDRSVAEKILLREKDARVHALTERVRQTIEFMRDNGLRVRVPEEPANFFDAVMDSPIMMEVRPGARHKLFKPRNEQERMFRDLSQDDLNILYHDLDYNSGLMYYGAAETAKNMTLQEARDWASSYRLDTKGNKRVVLQRIKDNARDVREKIDHELKARELSNLDAVRPNKTSGLSQGDKRMLMADDILQKGPDHAKAELMTIPMKDLKLIRERIGSSKKADLRKKSDVADDIVASAEGKQMIPGFDERVFELKKLNLENQDAILSRIFPREAGFIDMAEIFRVFSRLFHGPIEGSKAVAALVHTAARALFNKHVTEIRRLNSSTAKRLAERMVPSDVAIESTRPKKGTAERIARQFTPDIQRARGWFEDVRITQATYIGRVDGILQNIRQSFMPLRSTSAIKQMRWSMIPPKVQRQIKLGLQGQEIAPGLQPYVNQIREVLDDFFVYLVDSEVMVLRPEAVEAIQRITDLGQEAQYAQQIRQIKLDGAQGYQRGYFPHLWDDVKVRADQKGFDKYLKDFEGIEDASVRAEIMSKILSDEGFLQFVESTENRFSRGMDKDTFMGRVGNHPGHAAQPTFFQRRSLNGNFPESQKYQINDIEAILNSYFYRGTIKAEYTAEFGRGEWKLNRMVRDIILEEEAYNSIDKTLPLRDAQQIAQDIYDMVDAAQHRYGVIKNPRIRTAERGARSFTVMAQLGLVAFAQVPESMIPLLVRKGATSIEALRGTPLEWLRVPAKSYINGTAALAKDWASWASTLPTGKRLISEPALKKHLQSVGMAGYGAFEMASARWTGPLGTGASRFLTVVGMQHITRWQRMVAMDTIRSIIFDNARDLAKLTEGRTEPLARNQMKTKERMMRNELSELGVEPEMAIDWYRRGASAEDPVFGHAEQTAMTRGVERTIIEPHAGNIPKYINSQRLALVWLFSRFYSVFGNTVVKPFMQKIISRDVTMTRKASMMGAALSMVGLAYYIQFLREEISGYQLRDEDDPLRWLDAGDRSGFGGGLSRLYHIISPYKYAGGEYAVTSMLGPFYGGIVPDIVEGTQAMFSDQPEVTARHLAANTPFVTISGEVQDEYADQLEEQLDILAEYISDIQETLGID